MNTRSGPLSKAQLIFDDGSKINFHINPSAIDITRIVKMDWSATMDGAPRTGRVSAFEPMILKLPEIVFDTYEEGTSVRTIIDRIEAAVKVNKSSPSTTSVTNRVRFNWGKFTQSRHDEDYHFVMTAFNVKYTMFLPDGTPVRAKVTLTLNQLSERSASESSRQGTEVQQHTVRAGETVQSIAGKYLGDPGAWRTICKANGIDNPMNLKPGSTITIPPKAGTLQPAPPRAMMYA